MWEISFLFSQKQESSQNHRYSLWLDKEDATKKYK